MVALRGAADEPLNNRADDPPPVRCHMLMRYWLPLILTYALLINLITWATYRLDKRRAQRGQRRISEHTLLGLAAYGGVIGALWAVFGHRQRHKAAKAAFMRPLWSIVLAYGIGGLGVCVWLALAQGFIHR